MKTTNTLFKNRSAIAASATVFFASITAFSFAQSKGEEEVTVKVVRIVDGDTTTIEKKMGEVSVQDFTKQFQNIKGKNVQVMITVEESNKDKMNKNKKESSSMHFNFDMDSLPAGQAGALANSFAKAFVLSDSAMSKSFVWNDSMMKNFPKNFDFKFDFDDESDVNDFDFDLSMDKDKNGKTMIIKNGNGKTIVINADEDNVTINKSENGKTKTKTIVINDDKSIRKKKVIVSTSVIVIDEDDNSNKRSRSDKEESSFNFYPNPSDGKFTLDLDLSPVGNNSNGVNGKEDALVKITDMNSREVYHEKISGNGKMSKTIDLNGKKGTFIVTIKQGKRTTSKKIIIE